ncbi:MAG: hypothetical protein GEV28_02375 [Actinophytocola sp.]|uniref:type IV toxin-antitoxin system AbiEi family antitoxin domain-containing protein n=1 Tax=Actinophytocola sp. TaxID=1872138 RepID=UPI001329993A|nr:type IV toxin-antitoxin system AbiEi family antitoxin domain-containing protein [Actinophytocola sp.]MPZ79288.1 hypothetical protein [Actinophytocola sp.]
MSRRVALSALSEVTPEQWGMVTAAQARLLGITRVDLARLVADGTLEQVEGAARVYRLAGSPPDPELDPLRAAWLQLGGAQPATQRLRNPDAIASHRSAAAALRLGDLLPTVHEFYVSRRRQPRRPDLRLRVRRQLPRGDWRVADGLPVCTAPRVIADLLADSEDESAVARICQDAVRGELLNPEQMAVLVAPHAVAYGAGGGRELGARLLGVETSAEREV